MYKAKVNLKGDAGFVKAGDAYDGKDADDLLARGLLERVSEPAKVSPSLDVRDESGAKKKASKAKKKKEA